MSCYILAAILGLIEQETVSFDAPTLKYPYHTISY